MSAQEASSMIAEYSTLTTENYVTTAACGSCTLDSCKAEIGISIGLESLQYFPWARCIGAENSPSWYTYSDVAVLVITWRAQHSTWKVMKILPKTNYLTRTFHAALYENNSWIICFNEPITAILVSTFLTKLRKAADSEAYQTSISSMGSLEFRVVGSIGASLSNPEPLPEEAEEEMEMVEIEHAEEGTRPLASSNWMEIEEVARSEEHVDV
ncbi:hypothetical protein C8Q70DRAFT_937647 [Cubamyces menziesii]|nr:hypothetical protein C8Q70DRAFT_937647 [Cubamyces menziesii]